MNRQKIETYFPIVASILLATLFCLKFSVTTSPFYHINGQDSAIFYIIGKYWAEGSIPYADLWDHKGPIIFFINCLGYLITKSKLGVLLLQICSLSVFNFFTYKTFRLTFSALASFALNVFSLFWLACSYEGGNLTEEYLLPYLAAAIFFVMHWIRKRESSGPVDINPWTAFLLGGILAFSFLTRLTNALGACGMMLGIGLVLLFDKRWKNLVKCVLFYIIGFVVICLPFFIYFGMHHALDDMLFGTFFYNMSNISSTTGKNSSLAFLFSHDHFLFMVMAINCFGLLLLCPVAFFARKEHRVGSVIWFLAAFFLGLWYFRCEPMSHYRTVAVPLFSVLFTELYQFRGGFLRWGAYTVMALLLFGPSSLTLRKFNSFARYFDETPTTRALKEAINETIPAEELDSFAIYSGIPALYLELGVKPIYHNFSFPETQSIKSQKLKEDIIQEYSSCKAKWILRTSDDEVLISPVLESEYVCICHIPQHDSFSLWKRISNE